MKTHNHNLQTRAFTLVEMLVVISIIGILATMVVGLASLALRKSKLTRVKGEFVQLQTAIEAYKARKGFYPPSNPNDTQTNALCYELAGAINNNRVFTTLDGQDKIDFNLPAVMNACGVDGIANSSTGSKGDDNFMAETFLAGFKSTQFVTNVNGIKLFNVPVEGVDKNDFNPWHYNSSHPTNNPDSYDLWGEFLIGRKTNIICNWSASPIVVGD